MVIGVSLGCVTVFLIAFVVYWCIKSNLKPEARYDSKRIDPFDNEIGRAELDPDLSSTMYHPPLNPYSASARLIPRFNADDHSKFIMNTSHLN